jgi:transposase-like protein
MAKLHFPYPGPRQTEQAAFAYVEAHLWANGRVCPHCGVVGESSAVKGKTTRAGLYKCYACRKPFTLRMGTIFEGSHLPLHLWLHVIHLMCASKKGISTRQIQRVLNCSMKTAWFLTHRIREVMAPNAGEPPLGGRGKIRSQRILEATKMTAQNVVRANVHPESILHTDGPQIYREIGATNLWITRSVMSGSAPLAVRFTPIPLKGSLACSSAAWLACISTVVNSTLTAIWLSSISAPTTARSLDLMT